MAVELRLRLSWAAYTALAAGGELVFPLPDTDLSVSLALDDDALAHLRERVNAWLLERVPTAGGQH